MAEKVVKAKQPEAEKPQAVHQKPKSSVDRDKPSQPNRITRWYRETVGELRKVSWPAREDAVRLTKIVLLVMAIMGIVLGALDFAFSYLIALLVA